MPSLQSVGVVLWSSQVRVPSVNLNQKSAVLVSPTGILSKGLKKHTGTGRQGRWLITRAIGEILSGT